MERNNFHNSDGFSLVEVIAVLAILFIITALIVSRTESRTENLSLQSEVLKNHLRSAQAMAMACDDPDHVYGIKWDSAFYWIFQGLDPDSNIIRLFDNPRYASNDNKLSLAAKDISVSAPFSTIFFDQRGIPYSAFTETGATPLSTDLLITVKPYGTSSPSKTLTLTQHTGFIP